MGLNGFHFLWMETQENWKNKNHASRLRFACYSIWSKSTQMCLDWLCYFEGKSQTDPLFFSIFSDKIIRSEKLWGSLHFTNLFFLATAGVNPEESVWVSSMRN